MCVWLLWVLVLWCTYTSHVQGAAALLTLSPSGPRLSSGAVKVNHGGNTWWWGWEMIKSIMIMSKFQMPYAQFNPQFPVFQQEPFFLPFSFEASWCGREFKMIEHSTFIILFINWIQQLKGNFVIWKHPKFTFKTIAFNSLGYWNYRYLSICGNLHISSSAPPEQLRTPCLQTLWEQV